MIRCYTCGATHVVGAKETMGAFMFLCKKHFDKATI